MFGKYPAHVALGARRSASRNPFKAGSMTVDVGTAGRPVQLDKIGVQGVGEISPLKRMNRRLVAQVTLRAGDTCGPALEIIPVAIGADEGIGLRIRHVSGRQPTGRVNPAHGPGTRGAGTEVGRFIRVPSASAQQEKEREQQQDRLSSVLFARDILCTSHRELVGDSSEGKRGTPFKISQFWLPSSIFPRTVRRPP